MVGSVYNAPRLPNGNGQCVPNSQSQLNPTQLTLDNSNQRLKSRRHDQAMTTRNRRERVGGKSSVTGPREEWPQLRGRRASWPCGTPSRSPARGSRRPRAAPRKTCGWGSWKRSRSPPRRRRPSRWRRRRWPSRRAREAEATLKL